MKEPAPFLHCQCPQAVHSTLTYSEDHMNTSVFLPSLDELSTNWWRIFTETCEMLNATTQVVIARMARLAMAGPLPNERDRIEFNLMGREKNEAAFESI